MKIPITLLAVYLAVISIASAQEAVVIAHPSNSVQEMTAGELEDILNGKKKQWSQGEVIEIAILKGGPAHEHMLRTYVKKTPLQFKAYWRNLVFSGRGVMPQEFETNKEMISYVAKNSHAIGYIDAGAADESVKVIVISP